MCSAPPAGTTVFFVLSSGSVILIPPGGGRRLPWKSLIARIRNSTCAALCAIEDAASVVVIANAAGIRRKRRLMMLTYRGLLFVRHCERSEAIHSFFVRRDGLLRSARNDGGE